MKRLMLRLVWKGILYTVLVLVLNNDKNRQKMPVCRSPFGGLQITGQINIQIEMFKVTLQSESQKKIVATWTQQGLSKYKYSLLLLLLTLHFLLLRITIVTSSSWLFLNINVLLLLLLLLCVFYWFLWQLLLLLLLFTVLLFFICCYLNVAAGDCFCRVWDLFTGLYFLLCSDRLWTLDLIFFSLGAGSGKIEEYVASLIHRVPCVQ